MADDKTKAGKPDRDRINIDEAYELQEHFGVSQDKLKETVQRVGPMVSDVEKALRTK